MAKVLQSPLVGFNNNVRHKNRVFHIQTEDSGIKHPHIITHLFMDGGRILKSVKRSYAEHVGNDEMSNLVRQMMKEQHKAMFIALKDGQFDELVDQHVAAQKGHVVPAPPAAPPAPSSATSILEAARNSERPAPEPREMTPANPPVRSAPPAALPPIPMTSGPLPPQGVPEPAPEGDERRTEIDSALLEAAAAAARAHLAAMSAAPSDGPRTMRDPVAADPGPIPQGGELPPMRPRQSSVVDLETLEKAAEEPGTPAPPSSPFFNASDLPPPPKNLFREKMATGEYRAHAEDAVRRVATAAPPPPPRTPAASRPLITRSEPPRGAPSPQAQPARAPTPAPEAANKPGAPSATSASGRYAPARPASIFTTPPRPKLGSIVDDERGTDRTLDEVILSYLAEDLEPPKR